MLKDATQEEVSIAVLQVIGCDSPLNPALVSQPAKQPGSKQNKERPRGRPPSEGSKESPESLQRFAAGLRGEKSRSWECWLRGTLLGYCVIDVPALNGSVESTSWLLGL